MFKENPGQFVKNATIKGSRFNQGYAGGYIMGFPIEVIQDSISILPGLRFSDDSSIIDYRIRSDDDSVFGKIAIKGGFDSEAFF